MSLLLKITLSILTTLFINGCVSAGIWFAYLREYAHPLDFISGRYVLVSVILTAIAICYIPFMLIWHLY